MSGWSKALLEQLEEALGEFGITEIRNPEFLELAQQTGFVWTARTGVVCLAMNRKYIDLARDNRHVAALIVPPEVADHQPLATRCTIVSAKADQLYHYLHATQIPTASRDDFEIHESARVDDSAVLRGSVRIGAGAIVGARAVIDGPADIGSGVRIDAGAVVGCEGLYVKTVLGARQHIPHFGGVTVEDGAFIHAGAVVVRSAVRGEVTRIGRGAHVGILSNIGHDVAIGEGATISSNVVIAGRARVGARAWIGASATVSNMISVGDDAEVRIGAVVIQDVPSRGDVSGNFAISHGKNLKRFLKDVRNDA